MRVNVWTVNEADELLRLRDAGVDAVITDVPDLARDGAQGVTMVRQSGPWLIVELLDLAQVVAVDLPRERRVAADRHAPDVGDLHDLGRGGQEVDRADGRGGRPQHQRQPQARAAR